ncbi:cryptococcal mannosyltransferase 1-domain-containing protein [Aspergillus ambiguus]|uniref:glycosyltransferase family 69 protein n=1 Tax=Aspergillus ambiguus TaxID=176160 RepID=UPI003CCD5775
MLIRSFRYRRRHRLLHALLIILFIWSAAEVTLIQRHLAQDPPRKTSHHTLQRPRTGRIFIASIHWNDEIILRSHWNQAVVDLVQALGPQNVFVSVYESGSYDNTKDALMTLDRSLSALDVPRNITLSEVTHWDEMQRPPVGAGWVQTIRGKKELRRVPYLARTRNISLEPLIRLAEEGLYFDTILFLNDVVFTVDDVFTLLETNNGHYDAACSLDFTNPPRYYDTFALRDTDGKEPIMQTWPYFASSVSRRALERMDPVPVRSCWNGMVAMPASPFLSTDKPLRFRGIPDSLAQEHLEGSECCLIHADNAIGSSKRVYLNPRVRVGYNGPAYEAVHPEDRWLSSWRILKGIWASRLKLWSYIDLRGRKVHRRLSRWERKHGLQEPGDYCLVDEMQVLMEWGWAHL